MMDYLSGLRYRNETVPHELKYCSMAGGMEIFIDGAGFDEMAPLNRVLFDSTQQENQRLTGIPLESKLKAISNKLSCCS